MSNTTKSFGQLIHDPHAILLENALIETGSKLNLSIPQNLQSQGDPGAYIVQASGPISPAFRAMLAAEGATIVSYIPNDAYLVRATAGIANELASSPLVQAVLPYEPYYKVQPSLLAMANEPLPQNVQLNLGLFPDDTAGTIQQIEKLGGILVSEEYSPAGYDIVQVEPPSNWTAIAGLPGVHVVEPALRRHLANDLARAALGVSSNSVIQTDYMNLYGSNVVIEVNDSGIDTNHPDLAGRVFFLNPANGIDTDGHGTHVAGIIAGSGLLSPAVTNASGSIMPGTNLQFRGKAPFATMLSMSYLDSDQDLQEAAAETNALISNNSWNYTGDYDYDLAAASYDAATRDALPFNTGPQPVCFVFSAGNDAGGNSWGVGGNVSDTIDSPGTAKDVITVGALEEYRYITNSVTNFPYGTTPWLGLTEDSYDVPGFSGSGNVGIGVEGTYGRFKPDVVAPGTMVVSCRSTEWATNVYYHPTNDAPNSPYVFPDLIQTDSVSPSAFSFFVPSNTVEVLFYTLTNAESPSVLPVIPIYLSTNGLPYSFIGNNYIEIAPSSNTLNSYWSVEGSNVTSSVISYDLVVQVLITNDWGNYYPVLENMNNTLCYETNGIFPYRYESGTSMAAASISGFLALIQDYFTNQLGLMPSPALLKAMTINGARITAPAYDPDPASENVNFEGWGLPDLSNSVPMGLTNLPAPGDVGVQGPYCSTFFRDQNISNALATGDSETFIVNVNTNSDALYQNLQITLAWTDPPGDPVAALKLVNSLELVVTDLDNPSIVYYGNDIGPETPYNTIESSTNAPVIDNINNVQNIFIQPFPPFPQPDSDFSITVIGNQVNVNAVTEQTNNTVQDFALVISSGDMGAVSNAFTVTDEGVVSNPTNFQDITIGETNTILFNQNAGANTPLLGTNTIAFTANTVDVGTNGQFTAGLVNQWHFYVVTNTTTYANAAFITFDANTLSLPRMGVFANSDDNSTTPGADIDLLVTRSSTDPNAANLLNLDPVEISNCVDGPIVNGAAVGDGASLVSGGTDFVAYTNAQPGEVFYIGVKCENQQAVEYSFIPIFTQTPFSGLDQNGNEYLNAVNVPAPIPGGTSSLPGVAYLFSIALFPIEIQNTVVTNVIFSQNFGSLVGSLKHNGNNNTAVVLNNHNSINVPGTYTFIYDDNHETPGATNSAGPGSLRNFDGAQGQGVWQFTEQDNTLGQTGEVLRSSIFLQKYQNPQYGVTAVVQPGQWYNTYVVVPPGVTNLQLFGAYDVVANPPAPYLQMYLNTGDAPTATSYLFEDSLTNPPPAPIPAQYLVSPYPTEPPGPWNLISDGPPLAPGTYYIGVFNPYSQPETVYLLAILNGPSTPPQPTLFSSTNAVPILNDAVTNTTIFVNNSNTISSVNVGFVVQYPRISDLAFTLISPSGQRILLMQNRGGPLATNAGGVFYVTNTVGNVTATGSTAAQTNSYNLGSGSGSVTISYDMFTIPDEMTVYYGTNPATFYSGSLYEMYDSGMVSGTNSVTLAYPPNGLYPSSSDITVILNQFGNTNAASDSWIYSINGIEPDFNYLTFTEDTNLTVTPIKFAIPPFDLRFLGTNFIFGDLDFATNGDYFGQTNIYDPYGGWFVPTNLVTQVITNGLFTNNYNEVSIVDDPGIAYNGTNYLALGYGIIQRTNYVTPYRMVSFSYQYRGPGIAGWWRGEGNANDSSDAEQRGQNGSLIGRFDFPVGEVGQSFEMENNGNEFDFAGTNSYVQIRQQPLYLQPAGGTNTGQFSYLDVGTGPGFTVEGWINPTNVSFQQPLVEWLARVPTNGSDTNLCIRAGPFLYRGTDHYYYLLAATNWTTSETWAEELGGHLATVATADAQNWIYDTFANYHGQNRNLWIGLTNTSNGGFIYSSGYTNVTYTNWLSTQPTNCDGSRDYTLILGSTNTYPGLWALADNDGTICPAVSNVVYGVVEVPVLQTNGVQLWISVTNAPGTTNLILTNTGCLFANLVDVSNVSHWIYSGPNLIQSNAFQHVALTYDTNSGLANLYYEGTNVASTNLGVFVPKTTGDVLLGKDMNLETNNYYGGLMDEMSIYGRALSDAEIQAIYSVSAYTTNRLVGKFNPSITPPLSLAEAQVVLGGMTNTILGQNDQWQEGAFSFTAQSNTIPMQVIGIEPGMLFDSFGFGEAPLGNLYYLPEQSLDELNGENAYGNWTLEIWNTRLNALATNVTLLSWQLQMILETNTPPPLTLGFNEGANITILPGQMVSLAVPVPAWATVATNILASSTQPLNVSFDQTQPPTGSNPGEFMFSGTSGSEALSTTSFPTNIIPGQTYYIGLQNTGSYAASAVFQVDFNITALTNDVPFNDTLTTNVPERYFSFDVTSTNAYEATFQLLKMNGNCDLVISKGAPLPTLTSSDYGSFNSGHANENIYVLTNSAPVPLSPGVWYLGVFNRDTHPVNYTVLVQELDMASSATTNTNVTIIPLTNGVPFNFTAGPGAALTNFFSFTVTNTITVSNGVYFTNSPASIQFQLYNLTGNGDLTVQTDAPPFAPPFFQSSQEPGTLPEYILIQTNNVLTNLNMTWYLGVPNETTNLIHYTILAVVNTNGFFPAFPGAQGAGGGALGGSWRNGYTNNTVYHVVNLNDSGPGSLRDAVSSTNRTIIFDVSGVIYLQFPLVITNSYLTIAGQTAPEGGITVAGAPVQVSSYAHDIVMRYLRFRPTYSGPGLFVANHASGQIYKFTPNGAQSTFATVDPPNGLAFNGAGDLFVGGGGSGNIYEVTPAGMSSNFATGLGSADPDALVFNSAGILFMSGWANGYLYEFTPGGAQSTFANGLNHPDGLIFNSAGDLFEADQGDGIIYEFTNGLATEKGTFASGLNQPVYFAFDSAGDLFVTDYGSGNIYKFLNNNGTLSTTPTLFATGLDNPAGLAFNRAGVLFVADSGSGNIYEFTPGGARSTFASGLGQPYGLAFSAPLAGLTTGLGGNALEFDIVSNVIADHVSLAWATNDDLAVYDSTNITVQWSVIADSLSYSNNVSSTNGGGSIVDTLQNPPGGGIVSLNHNLYADNAYANPQLGGNVALDFVNNVVYNWGTNSGVSDSTNTVTNYLNYVCNYLISGTNSVTNNIAFWGGTTNTWIFQKDNFIDGDTNGTLNGANTGWNMFTNLYTPTNQFPLPPVAVDEAYLAYEKVLDFAGVDMFRRDAIDSNIVEHVRRQDGTIITAPGILPTESTNLIYQYDAQDGIPDFWKITFGQAVTNVYNNFVLSSGYSELEEFDNWLAGPHALTMTNTPVGVNLQKLFGKTGTLSFYATNAVHGTVYLTNVLGSYTNTSVFSNTIAIFTPTNGAAGGTNYSGFASFDVYVTNEDTVAYFGPVTVSVFVSAVPPTYSEQAGYLTQNVPVTNSIGADTTIWYTISVPTNALAATNSLLFAGVPVNLWYSSNSPPTMAYPSDFKLLANSTNGSAVINVDGAPLPPVLVPGGTYYLGVQNTNNFATNYAVEVTFYTISIPGKIIIITPGQPVTNVIPPAASSPGVVNPDISSGAASPAISPDFTVGGTNNPTYIGVYVPPNAIAATNTFLFATGGPASLWFNQNYPPLSGYPGDYELITNYNGTTPISAVLTTNTVPPLVPGQGYYLAITNISMTMSDTNAFEVTFGLYYTPPILPPVTNVDIVAGNTLTVNDQATDTNAGTLFYYLTTAPPVNASISGSGQISWTVPTNTPGENVLFTTVVSNSFTLKTATNSFTVTVLPITVPGQPQTNTVAPNSVNWIVVNVPANVQWTTNILLYATNLPVNMLFTTNYPPTTNGAFVLMRNQTSGVSVLGTATVPTNIVSGGTYYLGIQNTNTVAVGYAVQVDFAYYSPPSLPPQTNLVILAGTTLIVTNTATDANPGTLVYSLATSPSVNASISTNGIITWATSASQSPGNYVFTTIVVNSFTTQSATNSFTVTVITPLSGGQAQTNTVAANSVNWQAVPVPANALWASNILLYAHSLPVNLLFTTNDPPMTNGAFVLIQNQTNGVSVLTTNTAPTNIVQGGMYYLGVQNTNNAPVTYALLVNFGPSSVSAHVGIVYTNIDGTNGFLITWLANTNDIFQVQETPSINTPVTWNTFTNIITYTGPLTPTNGLFSFFDNGSEYPFGPTRFYRLLLLHSASTVMLPVQTNMYILAGDTLVVTNTATDTNPGTFIYSLATSPSVNAAISANGIITWATTNSQPPGNYLFTTIITNSLTTESATNSFTVTVISQLSGGQAQTNTVPANSISWQAVSVPSNALWASNVLLYAQSLPVNVLFTTNSSPVANGASVLMRKQTTGVSVLTASTTPTNIVPGGVYYLGVQNTNNAPVTYALLVNFGLSPASVHVGIVYTSIGGTNGFLITWLANTNDSFQVQETPSINPPVTWNTFTNIITYTGPLTPTNGLFSFFDNGLEYPFGPTRLYRLLLLGGSSDAVMLPVQTNYVLAVAQSLIVTNTATDSNLGATLYYNLFDFPGPATNAAISPNGIITWTAGPLDAGSAYTFTTVATDNNSPPAGATNAFTVFVLPAPGISKALVTVTNVTLQWTASTNDLFQVQWTTNLVPVVVWTTLPPTFSSATGNFAFTDTNPPVSMKFYRLVWLPPP